MKSFLVAFAIIWSSVSPNCFAQNSQNFVLINSKNLVSYSQEIQCEVSPDNTDYLGITRVVINLNQPNLPQVKTMHKFVGGDWRNCDEVKLGVASEFNDLLFILNQIENDLVLVDSDDGSSSTCYKPIIQGLWESSVWGPFLREFKILKQGVSCQ